MSKGEIAAEYADGKADGSYWASTDASLHEMESALFWAGTFRLETDHSLVRHRRAEIIWIDMSDPYWRGFVAGVKAIHDGLT